ncbi:MAG: hypothetical protein E7251_03665 [Paenibacillaceae bacterium]|nr:hypothetical protein [Paenibacillaceae bacterium]
MGQYNKAVLTAAGENLIARTLAGEIQLNITKAKTSNYIYPAGTDFKSLTDMQGIKQTATDPATAVYDDTMIQTRVLFSNEEIASTYYIHNIGLYAVDGTEEILFCIVTAETPDEMPQYNGVASTSYIYNIQNVVQDAAQLNITVNPSGTATIQDVLERVDATGGDISETVIETLDTVEDKYPVPAAGESVKRFFGKVLTFLRNIRPLTGDVNIYVSTTGSDITGDGGESNPYASIGKALGTITKDLGGYTAAINISDGTYNEDVVVKGISNGYIRLQRNGVQELNNLCNVKSIRVENCNSVSISGLNLTTTDTSGIFGTRTDFINVQSCQSVSNAGTQVSFNFDYVSVVRVSGNRSLNHNICLRAYASDVYSEHWSSDSIGFYGIFSEGGARISEGNIFQPKGMINDTYYSSGSIVVSHYGAVIGTLRYDLSLYVATTGSDTSGDGTNGNPFATIQHAIDVVPKDLGGYNATISVDAGTYSEDIKIKDFYGGTLNLYSVNKNTLTNTCIINSIDVSVSSAYIRVNGFNIVSTSRSAVQILGSTNVTVAYCQSVVTSSFDGIASWESHCIVDHCKIANHNCASRHGNGIGISSNWDSGSTGNTTGLIATGGARITVFGGQPVGTTLRYQEYGGIFINLNGTQISDLITSGLSCTWGTVQGGYYRNGNSKGGVAEVILGFSVTITTPLTANQNYAVNGIPPCAIAVMVASCSDKASTKHCYVTSSGTFIFNPSVNIGTGSNLVFGGSYITNS